MDIQTIRQQYPQYKDMSDQQLADALHTKFYADMPKDQFYTKIGFNQAPDNSGSRLLGGAEGDVNALVVNPINAIGKGLAGIAGLVKGAVTPGDSADNASQNFMESMPQIPQIQTSGGRTAEGNQAAQQAIGAIMGAPQAALNKAIDYRDQLMQKTGFNQADIASSSARARGIADIAGNVIPMLAMPKSPVTVKPPELSPLYVANKAGYSIMPSEAAIKGGSAPIGKIVEGLAGSAKTGVDATVKNQAVTNRLAAQEIGAPRGAPLTPTVLDSLRKTHNSVYDEVASLSDMEYKGPRGQPIKVGKINTDPQYFQDLNEIGRTPGNSFPDAKTPGIDDLKQQYAVKNFNSADAVLQIRNLRKNAQANYKASNANMVADAPLLGEKADAQMAIANALEAQLDRAATNLPGKLSDPTLIPRWRQARQSLAKINSVDNAIKEGTTDVSAPALAKQLNKNVPLSGNLKTIADAANAFPISVRDIAQVRNKVPINALEGLMGTGGLGAAMFGEPHAAMTLGAGMIARPAARAALLSGPIQRGMLPGQMSPEILKLIAPMAAQSLFTGNNNGL